ncbi:MAG: type IV-A pilus assembly ATPase PilB [Rubrivivax sp.]
MLNVLEERDIQVRGYNLRLPLDMLVVASANPEDYTNRGRIITPLKDRFGAEIRTHYPLDLDLEVQLLEQEANIHAVIPRHMLDVVARFTRAVRDSAAIDQRSGVSARFSIACVEELSGAALRRSAITGDDEPVARIGDLVDIVPSLRGKVEFDVTEEDATTSETQDVSSDVEDTPVVRFLQKMLVDAINLRASDLHFEPYEQSYRVRFRIDGELREIAQPPLVVKDKLASRIKVISRLDIAEKRVPQDGRMKLKFGSKSIDFRVSTLPTLFGEKIVIRILDSSTTRLGIDALGYEPIEKDRLMRAIERPYGMILVTGPTGSGKTVSLYTCLNLLNQPGVNIATVEDPCEINLPGVNQVNVNEKAGLTFSAALRAFLRQDPDILMVGEIRDLETADIAIKAAQTGHLVMSTLHTNDAPSSLTRLLNMGVAPFNIAASVLLITAQRLARRLCENCKAPAEYPADALKRAGYTDDDLDGTWRPYRAVGCAACTDGYRGRVGLYQVMPISEQIQRIILAQGSALDIAAQARREGVRDLRQAGLVKVRSGVTSLEEVITVTNE